MRLRRPGTMSPSARPPKIGTLILSLPSITRSVSSPDCVSRMAPPQSNRSACTFGTTVNVERCERCVVEDHVRRDARLLGRRRSPRLEGFEHRGVGAVEQGADISGAAAGGGAELLTPVVEEAPPFTGRTLVAGLDSGLDGRQVGRRGATE